MSLLCQSRFERSYSKPCHLCRKGICVGEYYETVKTKSSTYKGMRSSGKTLYVHTRCYEKEYIKK